MRFVKEYIDYNYFRIALLTYYVKKRDLTLVHMIQMNTIIN